MASKKKSSVWKFFELEEVEGTEKAKCTLCSCTLNYTGSSTSSLLKHLKSRHPSAKEDGAGSPRLEQTNFGNFIKKKEGRACPPERKAEITDLLCRVIYQDLRPLSFIRTPSFRSFLNYVEPNYIVPCPKTIRNNIIRLYDVKCQSVMEQLQFLSVPSLTTDHWTSAINDSYLGATAHGMTPEWKVKSMNLGTTVTSKRHTAENIANDLTELCNEWKLDKVFAYVHDNATKMVSAMTRLEAFSVPCFAHTLQLAINSGLASRTVANMITNARSLAGFFRKSNSASVLLQAKQKEMAPAGTILKPKQDVVTRWNSTYDMLKRLLQLKDAIRQIVEDRTLRADSRRYQAKTLRDDEWYLAHELVKLLEPLAQATEIWCGEHYVSVSLTYPIINGLLGTLHPDSEEDLPALYSFKEIVSKEIKRRFEISNPGMVTKPAVLASAVDPRFKGLSFLDEQQKELAYGEVSRLVSQNAQKEKQLVEYETTEEQQQPKKKLFWKVCWGHRITVVQIHKKQIPSQAKLNSTAI